jgi:hypothetical protein
MLGAHGTLEWLPGKPVAPSAACAPSATAHAPRHLHASSATCVRPQPPTLAAQDVRCPSHLISAPGGRWGRAARGGGGRRHDRAGPAAPA